MKLCKDCKYYEKSWWKEKNCKHPQNIEIDLVTGETMYKWSARKNRSDYTGALCTPSGKGWEAKKKNASSK